ncbi:MAG TPA: hypothetical protein VIM89_20060 [Mucilaginibacter sp.]
MSGKARINHPELFENPPRVAKVFVPTGSDSDHILVSLNEEAKSGGIQTVFAGNRRNDIGVSGVLVTVIFTGNVDPNTSDIILTLQQDGAQFYGASQVFHP